MSGILLHTWTSKQVMSNRSARVAPRSRSPLSDLTFTFAFSAFHLPPHALPSATPFIVVNFFAIWLHAGEAAAPLVVRCVDGSAPPLLFTYSSTASMSSTSPSPVHATRLVAASASPAAALPPFFLLRVDTAAAAAGLSCSSSPGGSYASSSSSSPCSSSSLSMVIAAVLRLAAAICAAVRLTSTL